MLGNQWFGIGRGFLQMRQGGGVTDIPERHTDIPEQAATFGSKNWCTGKTQSKGGLVQLQQFSQIRRVQLRA